MFRRRIQAVSLLLLALLTVAIPAHSQVTDGEAGVLVVGDDGVLSTHCVPLRDGDLSGYDLLSDSGLDVVAEVSGMGVTVCQIDDQGCPADNCFCQCRGGSECNYWSYWRQIEGEWRYSQIGAQATTVTAGSVEAWVWGPGGPGNAPPPPAMTLEEICAAPAIASPGDGLIGIQARWYFYGAIFIIAAVLILMVRRAGRTA